MSDAKHAWQETEEPETTLEEQARVAPTGDREAPEVEDAQEASLFEIPDVIPILPLRGVVVYPLTAQPLSIGQPRSVRLVDDVVASRQIVGLVASKDPELEEPMPVPAGRSAMLVT